MAKAIHDVVKDEIAQILRFYGFTVKEESPARIPEGGYGRVDVVGHKDSISVGVEVVDSGDVARDAKKLVLNGYALKYIIVLSPAKRVEKILINGEHVKVLDPESFEHELRRDLKIPPTYPYCMTKKPTSTPEIEIESTTSILQEIRDELYDIGLDNFVEDVFEALRRVYISKNLQVEKRVEYNPAARIPGRYKTVDVNPEILAILERLNLVNAQRVGSGYDRKLILTPNERGENAGRAIILKRVKQHKTELSRLIEEHNHQIWITIVGSVHRLTTGEPILVYTLHPIESLYDGALYKPKPHDSDPLEVLQSLYPEMYTSTKPSYYSPSVLLLASFISETTLREFAVDFYSRLERMGLAIQDFVYDSRWRPHKEVYKAPKEVFEFFLSRTSQPLQLSYYAQKLSAYYVIAKAADIAGREFYEELLRTLEISENEIAGILSNMNKLGITSKLIERADAAPFVVLNKRAFDKYLRDRIAEISKYFTE